MKKIVLPLSLAALMLLVSGCVFDFVNFDWDDYKYSYEDSLEHDLAGIAKVEIAIVNGTVEVEADAGNSLSIAIEERVKASDQEAADEIAEAVELKAQTSGDRLIIEPDFRGEKRLKRRWACKLKVTLPAEMILRVRSVNGAVSVHGMQADLAAGTTNGAINVTACKGDVNLSTTNGAIKAYDIDGKVIADTTNGSIKVEGTSEVRADTTNGGIDVVITGALQGDIILDTTNGGVSCHLPSDAAFQLNASTANGKIHSDFDGIEFNRRRTSAEGKVGDALHTIEISTTNGGISVRKADND